jgi:hypothetical protein
MIPTEGFGVSDLKAPPMGPRYRLEPTITKSKRRGLPGQKARDRPLLVRGIGPGLHRSTARMAPTVSRSPRKFREGSQKGRVTFCSIPLRKG